MSTVAFDVAAVRARFTALARPTAFFDGPGGTQVPDSVIEVMASYLREANANLGGAFETSRKSDDVVTAAHETAARFLGAAPGEVGFGANMTTLNFALSRAAGRKFRSGDEILVTRLDHDANVAPWLELARDRDLRVRFVDIDEEDCTLVLSDFERQLSDRTRVVAYPWASNAVGTVTDVRRIVDLAHEAGALAWIDAVHYAPHGPIDVAAVGADVLLCSPYKFFGPHLGLFFGRAELLERLRPYKVRPAADEPVAHRFETGTLSHEALAGFVAAVEYVDSVGWEAIAAHERELGERFLAGLPDGVRLHGIPTMDGRTPTFAITLDSQAPDAVAAHLAERDFAVWSGNYYALEIMERLGLPDGAVRVGFVHYNTVEEVDRILGELGRLAR
ncbi:MAG: cysteine desulfurase-like protein [Gaiellaceae bacterium]